MAKLIDALRLAEKTPIFPCGRGPGKKPLTKSTPERPARWGASDDTAVIEERWRQWPDAMIGVPAGERFVIVDLDLQHAEAQTWYHDHRRDLPLTRKHETRSGGRHLLFQPHAAVRNSAATLGPHIDTRGEGGYILWYPAEGFEVLHADVLAPVPEWIVEKLKRRQPDEPLKEIERTELRKLSSESAWRKLDGIIRVIARAPNGQRNTILFWGACRLAEMVKASLLSRPEAIAIALEAAARCVYPRRAALASIESAFNRIGV